MSRATMQAAVSHQGRGGPFDLDDTASYRAWRDRKLGAYPRSVEDLLVEIADPAAVCGFGAALSARPTGSRR